MLDVERRVDVDARAEKLIDVLPALGMTRAGRVGVRQLIDQKECRSSSERCVEIEFVDRRTLDIEHQRWKLLEALEHCSGFGAAVRLQQPDHDVGAGAT